MTINYSSLEKINIALESHENTELLIVSKKQSITDINNLIDNGYKLFGENRVQEAEEKYISDTVAAQYLQKNFKQFNHLHYNTIRRYFRDYSSGDISND